VHAEPSPLAAWKFYIPNVKIVANLLKIQKAIVGAQARG
jgi:hypothetical protein